MATIRLDPVHPGAILLYDFIKPMGLTRSKVAKLVSVPQRRIAEICSEKRAITADTAMRLARLFGMDAETWMKLQVQYDLEVAEIKLGDKIDHEVKPISS